MGLIFAEKRSKNIEMYLEILSSYVRQIDKLRDIRLWDLNNNAVVNSMRIIKILKNIERLDWKYIGMVSGKIRQNVVKYRKKEKLSINEEKLLSAVKHMDKEISGCIKLLSQIVTQVTNEKGVITAATQKKYIQTSEWILTLVNHLWTYQNFVEEISKRYRIEI